MSEVTSIESNNFYEGTFQNEELRNNTDRVTQLQQDEWSPIDYKKQALIRLLFGGLGISDFYVGNHLQGLAKLSVSIIIGRFVSKELVGLINVISLIQLCSGQYRDGDGKIIRQVVQLKKEEMSSCDQKTAFFLSSFLGFLGAHQFYAGKPLKGIMMLCSFGGLFIWQLMNIYQLATCGFRDGKGKVVCPDYIKLSAQK